MKFSLLGELSFLLQTEVDCSGLRVQCFVFEQREKGKGEIDRDRERIISSLLPPLCEFQVFRFSQQMT